MMALMMGLGYLSACHAPTLSTCHVPTVSWSWWQAGILQTKPDSLRDALECPPLSSFLLDCDHPKVLAGVRRCQAKAARPLRLKGVPVADSADSEDEWAAMKGSCKGERRSRSRSRSPAMSPSPACGSSAASAVSGDEEVFTRHGAIEGNPWFNALSERQTIACDITSEA